MGSSLFFKLSSAGIEMVAPAMKVSVFFLIIFGGGAFSRGLAAGLSLCFSNNYFNLSLGI